MFQRNSRCSVWNMRFTLGNDQIRVKRHLLAQNVPLCFLIYFAPIFTYSSHVSIHSHDLIITFDYNFYAEILKVSFLRRRSHSLGSLRGRNSLKFFLLLISVKFFTNRYSLFAIQRTLRVFHCCEDRVHNSRVNVAELEGQSLIRRAELDVNN